MPGGKWLFFSGIIISCIGESMLIGYAVFSYNEIPSAVFLSAITFLVAGNMLLVKSKLENFPIFKARS